ncbi:helix-turn-helix domain-containing protein [Clostridioides difficile]|nr:helix-turn-helix domain-containing protein [Clostridioides difficile]HBF2805548.1 helix-turn-helix domain-containing protein [Clostridioides difficile]HBF3756698.1 helix-turn-helix domain-containing protein [Clostridioides difficile]HBF6247035.1 helix-turn-helix domain-containing protein [Clostridioides difficile]HBG5524004.1 helix-turn-helix domain-containing protein [Clostridioides difficile]
MSIKYKDKVVFIVDSSEKEKLDKSGIEYETLEKGNYYVVTQGKKNKKFTNDEVKQIKEDLNNGMSIRKCAERWNCSTNVIMKVKRNNY